MTSRDTRVQTACELRCLFGVIGAKASQLQPDRIVSPLMCFQLAWEKIQVGTRSGKPSLRASGFMAPVAYYPRSF